MSAQSADTVFDVVGRQGLRFSWCMSCDSVCLAQKRSLCCGDAVYDAEPRLAAWLAHIDETGSAK